MASSVDQLSVDQLSGVPASADRADPMAILAEQDRSRLPDLVPVRHYRMAASAFTFYRGAAAVMASDLAATPDTGIITQLCGDAHLSNFGLFRSPERTLVFDLNDFDETHPGPFEWDVKRLAASVVIASQANGFDEKAVRDAARNAAKTYRKTMIASAKRTALACWYARVDADEVASDLGDRFDTATSTNTQKILAKARHRDSAQALEKLCYFDLAGAHIKSDPPLLMPVAEIVQNVPKSQLDQEFIAGFERYRKTLPDHVAALFAQYSYIEAARKVVGVGSVGTRCWIALFGGSHVDDPLFLQIKEASKSVLAPYVPGHEYPNEGKRVVYGQQLLQASSDIMLGWVQETAFVGGLETDFYVRQLRDGKGSVVVEALAPPGMAYYARLCGEVLAQAHARTAARGEIAKYLDGAGKAFDAAIADFAVAYSEINVGDHARLEAAIQDGSMSSDAVEKSS
ncbi:DUF2252 domain-containing protein [Gordonia sp. (in: high G+C Gram-positive bacteria)]|uniref:DUF2252 domain-containing protein n=1 Tax=Gordonia sp. (in: high G+C Gram-positive bacteria) TaxID=84139 RepID=UPI0016950228|nr:DUF2252 domain-containing protein [Gordonia sp. (in: high G+C Gram-positive bacteria)]NLG46486.1 DUF2252 domain-containing protein [Gordonia sp. (in: high G+C Gram-positive bacteria)]